MAEIPLATALQQVLAVLREAYEGPAHDWSYFTDTKPNAGMFGTLSAVTDGHRVLGRRVGDAPPGDAT